MAKTSEIGAMPQKLLDWYRLHARALPWRTHQGRAPSPYHTWLSEIMLQQTGVATVMAYYQRFTAKWPRVEDLAAAHEDEVLQEWAGLGYYSRARNLLKCAQKITAEYGGIFPSDLKTLKTLPGIGNYTASAIRSIAFDLPANVVDGNVERVIARIYGFQPPINLPKNKVMLRDLAARTAPERHPGDYAQGVMDLGAMICTPRKPKCPQCPWRDDCLAYATGQTETIPLIERRARLPAREADIFVLRNERGEYFLRQRPSSGLLGGLWEFPGGSWDHKTPAFIPPPEIVFTKRENPVLHVFTHFKLTLHVYAAQTERLPAVVEGRWFAPQELPALPTLMKKVLAAAWNGSE